ncbi:phosphopantetheine-binding protein [Frankia sp. CcI156]|jgi:acyl carrier protein|uniref:Phosphopantetheine-binding n=1 Tax=Frankia casuarinae (strain DSM 45818 / CECT 9043 / HFP020203 / CcI3) TaxID=106370 RepID=Q2JBP0_FRACC|nr:MULTISPECIES: acyl carrier protein [Frankia]ABD11302.1 phosphopantetheine-binding [Frankia casuarinae]ETA00624.1 acyl carrier protein [Frankia sp. CcI6]EYT90770.1 acyl carrier protein [Frankia casuarinae]KDA41580.1 acyl carrier protein [Frankia sp. BMG5.23]KEZ35072.1 acyl carrier protein [Frankia sp. CeD]
MSVSYTEIVTTVTAIVARELGIPIEDLAADADLRSVEGADSVKVLRMIARVEREYDVELEDDDVFSAVTVAEVADVVQAALQVQAA